jgi:hypothetical protein
VDATNEWFLGVLDEDTGEREESGFEDFIRQMEDRIDKLNTDAGKG